MDYEELKSYARHLERENTKLREEVNHLKKGDVLHVHVLTDQEFAEQQKHEREMKASVKALYDENAKLHELVRVMTYCMQEGTDCDGCKLNDGAGRIEALDAFWACDWLHERLRELGIEVAYE